MYPANVYGIAINLLLFSLENFNYFRVPCNVWLCSHWHYKPMQLIGWHEYLLAYVFTQRNGMHMPITSTILITCHTCHVSAVLVALFPYCWMSEYKAESRRVSVFLSGPQLAARSELKITAEVALLRLILHDTPLGDRRSSSKTPASDPTRKVHQISNFTGWNYRYLVGNLSTQVKIGVV